MSDAAMEHAQNEAGEHPEELLDRAVLGTLPTAEQEVLTRHLSVCRVCAGQLAIVRSAQKLAAPEPWDDPLNRRAVERALQAVERRRWPTGLSRPFRRGWALVTAGLVIGLGGMAGATWWHARRVPAGPGQGRALASAATSTGPSQRLVTAAAAAAEVAPDPTGEPAPSLAPAPPGDHVDARKAARSQPSASSLFEEASALRDHGRAAQAIAVYRRLQRVYPRARETRLSFALAGRLLLDGGHPEQALAQFEQHLAKRGDATEEALAGRATALGRMGRLAAERETWRTLLEDYPKTVYAARAKSRLAELDRSPPR